MCKRSAKYASMNQNRCNGIKDLHYIVSRSIFSTSLDLFCKCWPQQFLDKVQQHNGGHFVSPLSWQWELVVAILNWLRRVTCLAGKVAQEIWCLDDVGLDRRFKQQLERECVVEERRSLRAEDELKHRITESVNDCYCCVVTLFRKYCHDVDVK